MNLELPKAVFSSHLLIDQAFNGAGYRQVEVVDLAKYQKRSPAQGGTFTVSVLIRNSSHSLITYKQLRYKSK